MKKIKLLIAVIVFATLNGSAQFTKLHDFANATGESPTCSLISDGIYLYGMTAEGGSGGGGNIFKIKPDGTGFTTIFNLTSPQINLPAASLTYDGTFLYGTGSNGGTNNVGGVFKIKPNGTSYSNLVSCSQIPCLPVI